MKLLRVWIHFSWFFFSSNFIHILLNQLVYWVLWLLGCVFQIAHVLHFDVAFFCLLQIVIKKISAKFVEISYLIREIFNLGQLSIVLIVADGILSRTKNVIHCRRFMEISYCCWNAMTTSHFRSTYVITNCLFSINQSRKILCVYTSIYCIEISVSLCVCAMLLKCYRVTCRQHEIHKRHT